MGRDSEPRMMNFHAVGTSREDEEKTMLAGRYHAAVSKGRAGRIDQAGSGLYNGRVEQSSDYNA
jgi:hypothetical protein